MLRCFLYFYLIPLPGYRRRGLSEPDGSFCGGAVQSEQELFLAAGHVAKSGAATARLPVVASHVAAEGPFLPADTQVAPQATLYDVSFLNIAEQFEVQHNPKRNYLPIFPIGNHTKSIQLNLCFRP